ncbi:MAG: DUF6101 family protein [Methylocystis sp.]|uniref:DUF6101 family protein n=1 Tax=Methylocystis sp. TaxID=1911079 RepID=UPI003DA61E0E
MFEASHARADEAVLVQRDWRADGGARRVRVTSSDILISRRFGGVKMRISVPVPAYQGVLLDLVAAETGEPCYRLSLAHRDRDLDVVLAEVEDEDIATGAWADWADWLGLPRLAPTEEGGVADMDLPLPAARPAPRRGASSVRRRRPRFLACRKTGDAARQAAVHAGEREIISYE